MAAALSAQVAQPPQDPTRKPPQITHVIEPDYSEEANLAKVSGTVFVRAFIAADGSVKSVRVTRGIGFGLDELAEKAVSQWQFLPGQENGVPVTTPTDVQVKFNSLGGRPNYGPASLIFPKTDGVSRPVLINVPQKLVDAGQQDSPVVLDLEVDPQGHCNVVKIFRGSEPDASAVSRYVEQWQFKPAEQGGSAVTAKGRLTFLMGKEDERMVVAPPQGGKQPVPMSRVASKPELLKQVDPVYSEEARRARVSATVQIRLVVDVDGTVTNEHVTHGVGFGLDEKALESVRQWKFKPAQNDGSPVPVIANVEVRFLLHTRPHFGPNALVFALEPDVTRPELLKMPKKVYDDGTDRDAVVLDIDVDANGRCKVARVIRGNPTDVESVTASVEKWVFQPAELNHNPVAAHGRLRFLLGKPDPGFIEAPGVPAP